MDVLFISFFCFYLLIKVSIYCYILIDVVKIKLFLLKNCSLLYLLAGKHEDKVLCTDWRNGKIASGAADNKLRITDMP